MRCPACGGELNLLECSASCLNCESEFFRKNSIADFFVGKTELPPFYNDPAYLQGVKKMAGMHESQYNINSVTGKVEMYMKREMLKITNSIQPPAVDIGCGTGSFHYLLDHPADVVGIDVSDDLLQIAVKRFPGVDFIKCDINNPPFKTASLETVFCLFTLEHVFYLEKFLMSLESLLSPTGRIYAALPTEGGLTWSVLRSISNIKYSNRFNVNYKKVAEKEHCNHLITIENTIKKLFKVEKKVTIPFRIGGYHLNLARLLRLRKYNANR